MIDDDIRSARTLPASFYRDAAVFERIREQVFARSWQLVLDAGEAARPGSLLPFSFLAGCLDEPLLLARDPAGTLRGMSNVCTHRANLLCTKPESDAQALRCRYHGRRFGLDGRFLSMPEFEGVRDFPSRADDLPRIPLGQLGPLLFAAIDPVAAFEEWIAPVRDKAPLGALALDPSGSREYEVAANWALYCDNYLEGFHVPFVHAGLAKAIDYGSYRSELFSWGTLQT
ncbi:MAG: aromatic ring-hydroxylating oxygenase subunit alpha, partial [Myxococcales bacterium]